jgi:DNA polymerase I-like protein with 3'-5' exonuclease and polymerase domains
MDAIVTYQIYTAQKKHMAWVDENFPATDDQFAFNVPLTKGLQNYFYEYVMPAVRAFNDIEWEGAYINVDALREEGQRLEQEIATAGAELRKEFGLGPEVDIDSAQKLSNALKRAGYPLTKMDKNRTAFLLNDEVIHSLEKAGYPEFKKLQHYRQLKSFLSTFIGRESEGKKSGNGLWQHLRQHPDGTYRIHSSMMVFLANSGRNRSKNPNLQNIPKRGGDGAKRVRRVFCPPSKDYYIMEADGAGYQLRIGAALSGDTEMRRAFSDPKIKGDLHSVTTQAVFLPNMSVDEILEKKAAGDKEIDALRFKGKQTNLSLEFGASGWQFASALEAAWSQQELYDFMRDTTETDLEADATRLYNRALEDEQGPVKKEDITMEFCRYWAVANLLRRKFFIKYPELGQWIVSMGEFANQRGYVRSVHGAFRRLPELLYDASDPSARQLKKHLLNIAVNSPVQNFENVVMSGRVIAGLHRFLKENHMRSRIATMVHDSVVIYVHKDEVKTVVAKAKELFEAPVPENNGVPMELEAAVADYWGRGEVWGEGEEY